MLTKRIDPGPPHGDLDRDESMAHLSVVLAHRLRGLVASIEGFTDLLQDTLQETEQRELAMKIMEGAARIESVLADLQMYGESFEPVMLPVRVDEILRELLVPLEDDDRDRIDVSVEAEAGDVLVSADPFMIRQGLIVLLQNALEAAKRGSAVLLRIRPHDDSIRFEVWNDGVVDSKADIEAIFTPFFTTKAHNLGVGLSIARRVARVHDAAIELTVEEEKQRTCFAFVIQRS